MQAALARIRPRDLTLTNELWLAAAALAGLRVAVNDPSRRPNRDSGPEGNALNDLVGALSELIALRAIEGLGPTRLAHNLLDLHHAVDDVDLTAEFHGSSLQLEVKGHFHDSRKRYFLVNEQAQARSRRRDAQGHLPVVTRLLHDRARVGQVIRIDEIERPPWQPPRRFGARDDPAWSLPLKAMTDRYLGGVLIPPGRPVRVTRQQLDLVHERAQAALPRLRSSGFSLRGLPAAQIVRVLAEFATR
jgi:hypothetical protein